jgi:cell division protein FtsB
VSGHADTIRIQRARDWLSWVPADHAAEAHADLDALVAENQRLRDALQLIADDEASNRSYLTGRARAALAGTPSEDT